MSGTYKGVGGGGGLAAEGGLYLQLNTGNSAVSSLSDQNRHNPQDEPRQWLAAV